MKINNIKHIFNIKNYEDNFIRIQADIIDKCNFSCSYCCASHYLSNKKLDLKILLDFIKNLNRKTKVQILGGEPTLHEDLLWFAEKHRLCNIFSNFSAPVEIYNQLLSYDAELTLSYHTSSLHTINSFFEKYLKLKKDKLHNVFVSIVYENLHSQECAQLFDMFYKCCKNNYMLKDNLDIFLLKHNTNTYATYNLEQIKQFNIRYIQVKNKKDELYKIRFLDNSELDIMEDELFEKIKPNFFKRWQCNASIDCLYVSSNGEVYPCPQCFQEINNKKYMIGNIAYGKIKKQPIICPISSECCMPEIKKVKIFKTLSNKYFH